MSLNVPTKLRQSRSAPTSPVPRRRQVLYGESSSVSASTTPVLLRRRHLQQLPGITFTTSGSPPCSVKSFSTSNKTQKKKPSYMRSTVSSGYRSVRNTTDVAIDSSSDDESGDSFEERRYEFAAPVLLPPIWSCPPSSKSPSLRKKADVKVLPSIRISPVEQLEKEFSKLGTCRYLRNPSASKSSHSM